MARIRAIKSVFIIIASGSSLKPQYLVYCTYTYCLKPQYLVDLAAMEHSWTEYRPVKDPKEGDPEMRVHTINRIKLFGHKDNYKVKFNCEDKVGYWRYLWSEDGPCYMVIEFKASHKLRDVRRHFLVQMMEHSVPTYELLPPDHPVYRRADVWKHSEEIHLNAFPSRIVMQRLNLPAPAM